MDASHTMWLASNKINKIHCLLLFHVIQKSSILKYFLKIIVDEKKELSHIDCVTRK